MMDSIPGMGRADTTSIPALEHIQYPILWVPLILFQW